jgi:hypothetical protein
MRSERMPLAVHLPAAACPHQRRLPRLSILRSREVVLSSSCALILTPAPSFVQPSQGDCRVIIQISMLARAPKRVRGTAVVAASLDATAEAKAAAEALQEDLQCPVCYHLPDGVVNQVRQRAADARHACRAYTHPSTAQTAHCPLGNPDPQTHRPTYPRSTSSPLGSWPSCWHTNIDRRRHVPSSAVRERAPYLHRVSVENPAKPIECVPIVSHRVHRAGYPQHHR